MLVRYKGKETFKIVLADSLSGLALNKRNFLTTINVNTIPRKGVSTWEKSNANFMECQTLRDIYINANDKTDVKTAIKETCCGVLIKTRTLMKELMIKVKKTESEHTFR